MKHLFIGDDAHKELKEYCNKRHLKLKGTVDRAIIEGVRVLKLKEQQNVI